jgi:hypothetical protein
LDTLAATTRLRSLAAASWIDDGEDNGPYINIAFEATDPAGLWAAIRGQLLADPELAGATIVVCEGEHGWHDYLLLHHFDPTEPLDEAGRTMSSARWRDDR